MSIIRTPSNCNIKNSVEYRKFIIRNHIVQLLSKFYDTHFTIHGYYIKKVFLASSHRFVSFRIMRIRDSKTGKTHAILFDFMVPYHRISSRQLIDIIRNNEDPGCYDLLEENNHLYRLLKDDNINTYVQACDILCHGHRISQDMPLVLRLGESGLEQSE